MRLAPLAFTAALLAAPAARAQDPLRPAAGTWRFGVAPQVDLWFHGLAVLGYGMDAALPLYDSAYAAAARPGSALAALPTLRDTFERDPAFQILHFLPLYFTAADPLGMLGAVEDAARTPPGTPPAVRDPRLRRGAEVVALALPRGRQREALREFVRALRRDWESGFRARWDSAIAARRDDLEAAQALWDSVFAPRLAPLLFAGKLDYGSVFVSRPLGLEGRLVTGDRRTNVAAVLFTDGPAAILYATVREMCFEWMRGVVADHVAPAERRGREQALESRAAVRCGARVLERLVPEHAEAYRRFYAEQGAAAFEEAYAVPDAVARGLGARLDFLLGGI